MSIQPNSPQNSHQTFNTINVVDKQSNLNGDLPFKHYQELADYIAPGWPRARDDLKRADNNEEFVTIPKKYIEEAMKELGKPQEYKDVIRIAERALQLQKIQSEHDLNEIPGTKPKNTQPPKLDAFSPPPFKTKGIQLTPSIYGPHLAPMEMGAALDMIGRSGIEAPEGYYLKTWGNSITSKQTLVAFALKVGLDAIGTSVDAIQGNERDAKDVAELTRIANAVLKKTPSPDFNADGSLKTENIRFEAAKYFIEHKTSQNPSQMSDREIYSQFEKAYKSPYEFQHEEDHRNHFVDFLLGSIAFEFAGELIGGELLAAEGEGVISAEASASEGELTLAEESTVAELGEETIAETSTAVETEEATAVESKAAQAEAKTFTIGDKQALGRIRNGEFEVSRDGGTTWGKGDRFRIQEGAWKLQNAGGVPKLPVETGRFSGVPSSVQPTYGDLFENLEENREYLDEEGLLNDAQDAVDPDLEDELVNNPLIDNYMPNSPTPYDEALEYLEQFEAGETSGEQIVTLWRGEGNLERVEQIASNRTAGGAANIGEAAGRPTPEDVSNQVAFGRTLPEYTSSPSTANGFSNGGYVVSIDVPVRYLARGSATEEGFVLQPNAPVDVTFILDRSRGINPAGAFSNANAS